MCGIVGIVGTQPVANRLVEGLRRVEYRGYDSAGIAVIDENGHVERRRATGKLRELDRVLDNNPAEGISGIAHTRWATHGAPTETNAHPHHAGRVYIVHNGIIENFRELREEMQRAGRDFVTETDTEVVAQLIDYELEKSGDPKGAFEAVLARLKGAFALAVMIDGMPDFIMGAREGAPLVVGFGEDEGFLGSDPLALAPFTNRVCYLEEGDYAIIRRGSAEIYDRSGERANRPEKIVEISAALAEKGNYRHFMEKEIHEQPEVIARTLTHYVDPLRLVVRPLEGLDFTSFDRVIVVACGTAGYAGQVAGYWIEQLAGLPVRNEVASEFRYREPAVSKRDLALFISQSGETADTLAAMRFCKERGLTTAVIVNAAHSTMAREADITLPTLAGPEIGVASTKAFTCQLAALAMLAINAGRARGFIDEAREKELVTGLLEAPRDVSKALETEDEAKRIASEITQSRSVLYLGRGVYFPLALEGALKLKEISYLHAEAYAAGELKHGPIALIEDGLPVVMVAPYDHLWDKTQSTMQEVAARGARVILVSDQAGMTDSGVKREDVILLPDCAPIAAPIVAAVAVQLLAYHAAVYKGTDVDQPRNLAKSVTVE
ncbi:MAG: glutamine--fructose-6-phosphate transaminase (isomerizing) [Maricaulis sp.]|jgi:glucosamine--fructose-6-phosphate aminotransferase (isomerizing)|nr:glutamine--fructose-6-phosphate transaminase (isomerizing) [Maricaulis sp.]HAQ36226.1 glutamine--fructose-6-phosphate transaminase (isomerizing) [Alphaproteobacteria bacterium]